MKKDNAVYIEDILNACRAIANYLAGVDFDEFSKDGMRQDAVMRNVELIGEAANRLTAEFAHDYPDFPIEKAVGMRNKLIHDYRDVELSIVWETVRNDIPLLKDLAQRILTDLDSKRSLT